MKRDASSRKRPCAGSALAVPKCSVSRSRLVAISSAAAIAATATTAAATTAVTATTTSVATATAATTTAASTFAAFGLVDACGTTCDLSPIKGFDGGLRLFPIVHRHETKALRPSCLAIRNHLNPCDASVRRKRIQYRLLINVIGEIPHVNIHGLRYARQPFNQANSFDLSF